MSGVLSGYRQACPVCCNWLLTLCESAAHVGKLVALPICPTSNTEPLLSGVLSLGYTHMLPAAQSVN